MTQETKIVKLNETKLQESIQFTPHEGQLVVLNSNARFRVLACGTRWGKSLLAAYIAFKELLKSNRHIWIVAPTYDLGNKIFRYLEQFIGLGLPDVASAIVKRPFPRVQTPWGSWVEVRSAENPTSLLGEEIDMVVIDEASRISEDVWNGYIYSRLGTRKGKAVIISTPYGKNWFYNEWVKAQSEKGAFHFPTNSNPYYPPEEWDKAKAVLPEQTFRQDFEAEFLDDAAAVFRDSAINACISEKALSDAQPTKMYLMGVDLGKYKDFTVLTVLERDTNKVVHIDRFKDINWPMQKARIVSTARRYNNARLCVDSTGLGDPITDDLRVEGLVVDDLKISGKSKTQLVLKLAGMMEQRALEIPPHEELLRELRAFKQEYNESETRILYGAPEGMHDDCVISLALAVWFTFPKPKYAPITYTIAQPKQKYRYE